jgi:hypothetical protein
MDVWAACYHAGFGGPEALRPATKVASAGVKTNLDVSAGPQLVEPQPIAIAVHGNGNCRALGSLNSSD